MAHDSELMDEPVCVLVDATDEAGGNAGRRNYWKFVDPELKRDRPFEEFAIREMTGDNRVFNFDQYETVILNTDLVNGDSVFGSDDSWMFFSRQGKVRLDAWFRNGKKPRLIVEHQGLRLIPSQNAYDAVLGEGEVVVPSFEPWFTALAGGTCSIVNQFRNHPVLRHLKPGAPVESCERGGGISPFFGNPAPSWLGTEENPETGTVFEVRNDSLFGGWFEDWDSEWVPVLRAYGNTLAPANNATMLVKMVSDTDYREHRIPKEHTRKGIIIATTLRLAAKAPDALIDGILNAEYDRLVRFHEKAEHLHRRNTLFASVLIALSFLAVSAVVTFAWDRFVIGSDNRAIEFFADALGLPLLLILFAHWRAARSFAQRGLFAGPRWRIPLYWLSRLIGRPKPLRSAGQG